MRPLRLDLHGFTVFREPTTVDFTDADFFALVGATGSGKSTVLDAICFALYGTVPRWADRRGGIENALAPSATQARVRLIFEAAGTRFVATRVVRRDGKGKVSTAHAGLEQLPPGYDLRQFDTAPAERDEPLGTVLAGTPAEMEQAVLDAVGLPYEQFTTCVVLPQGEFARFLHAKPKDRQDILVNLLGLQVYEKVGVRAGQRQREAEARAAASRSVLSEIPDADDAALTRAEESLAAAQALVGEVEARLPALEQAMAAGERARTQLETVRAELTALQTVRLPSVLADVHAELSAARDAARAAASDVDSAEDAEEKARAELAEAGDRTAIARLLDAHAERTRTATQLTAVAQELGTASAEQAKAAARLAKAQAATQKAAAVVAAAQTAVEEARTADRAASLRVHLVAGAPCPVCEQAVVTVPTTGAPKLKAAGAALEKAEQAARKAAEAEKAEDRALREAERRLATVTERHEAATIRLTSLESIVDGAPDVAALEASLRAIAERERAAAAAAEAVKAARQALRAATTRLATAQEREQRAWREYDAARDAVAALTPPAADRDRLVESWQALHAWAVDRHEQSSRAQQSILTAADAAVTALAQVTGGLDELVGPWLQGALRSRDAAAYRQAAALAVQRATAARDRVLEQRAQAAKLREQLELHEREAQVAKALAQHMKADRFEAWLLTEALDALVSGASTILHELSDGRYDLTHSNREFWVVDHSDAGLRRAVRTLSGGETFQASLALALALSEQLAGLSNAPASLESIMLDEGFGTLDPDTLDTVAATLENLAARGDRMVGVVTHVAGLAERIPVRYRVSRDPRGTATVVRSL